MGGYWEIGQRSQAQEGKTLKRQIVKALERSSMPIRFGIAQQFQHIRGLGCLAIYQARFALDKLK
jgi:hypothetical protein